MSYLVDELTSALGGGKLIGSQGIEYGKWTPNGIRTIGIFADAIMVEFHKPYNGGKIAFKPLNVTKVIEDVKDSRVNFFKPLEYKQLMGLEEVIVDSRLGIDPSRYLANVDSKARLRSVSVVQWSADHTKLLASRAAQMRLKDVEELWVKILGVPAQTAKGPGYSDWPARYSLNPRVYTADLKGGALETHFAAISEKHGFAPAVDEEEERSLTPAEEANALAHRKNVAIDASRVDDLRVVLSQMKRLRAGAKSGSSKVDSEGIKKLYGRLKEDLSVTTEKGIAGLSYYLETYGEKDGVPTELLTFYKGFGYVSDGEAQPSRAIVKEVNGYVDLNGIVVSAVRASYRSRADRKLYVPERSLFVPSVKNIIEFVDLLLGEDFDFAKYSSASNESGGEDFEKALDEAEGKYKTEESRKALEAIREKYESSGKGNNAEFWLKVRQGAVNASRDAYIANADTLTTRGVPAISKAVKAGVALYAAKSKWAKVLAPVAHKLVDASEDAVVAAMFDLLDKLEAGIEEEVSKVEEDLGDGISVGIVAEFLNDCCDFSRLKGRQSTRIAKAAHGVTGLEKYLEGKDIPAAGVRKSGYFDGSGAVEGAGLLFEQEKFYKKVLTEMAELEGRDWTEEEQWISSASGAARVAVLDTLSREVLDLKSRSYSGIDLPPRPEGSYS